MTKKEPLFGRILAATGTPQKVDPPVVASARLASLEEGHLKIAHAVTSARIKKGTCWPPGETECRQPWAVPAFADTARRLVARYSEIHPALTMEDIHIVPGVAWEVIFRSADELNCRLIVIGPHITPPAAMGLPHAKGLLGSTAEGVIRHARCPVMIVNRALDNTGPKFDRAVVGVDFSASCAAAICLSALLADRFSSQVHVFHMLPIPPYPKYTPEAFKVDHQRIENRLRRLSAPLLEGVEFQIRLKAGVIPHAALLEFARRINADLIVIGSHTKERAGKWYPGSVTQHVSTHADCPVMVVNGTEALTPWKDAPCTAKLASVKSSPLTLFPA